jgi:hypothetical protein
MKIAVVGCMHGELERTYETVAEIEELEKCKIELVKVFKFFSAHAQIPNDKYSLAHD